MNKTFGGLCFWACGGTTFIAVNRDLGTPFDARLGMGVVSILFFLLGVAFLRRDY